METQIGVIDHTSQKAQGQTETDLVLVVKHKAIQMGVRTPIPEEIAIRHGRAELSVHIHDAML